MPAISALLLVVVLAGAILMGVEWQRQQTDRAEERFLVSRLEALIDMAYVYRGDNHAWPSDSTELCSVGVDPKQCGRFFTASTDAYPMTISVTANDTLRLTIQRIGNAEFAKDLVLALGSQASASPDPAKNANASTYEISMDVVLPFRLSLLEETLLTDGSNAMNKPLMFASSESVGKSCKNRALAVDANGALLRCVNGSWTD